MVDIVFSKEDNIDIEEKQLDSLIEIYKKLADFITASEGINFDAEVSLSIVDSDKIQVLNRDFRGIDKKTDVLSFPMYEIAALNRLTFSAPPYNIPLGDVVIAYDVAQNQADEYGHGIFRELCYLFVHSMYHLLGYDHMDDEEKKAMRAKEEAALDHFDIGRL